MILYKTVFWMFQAQGLVCQCIDLQSLKPTKPTLVNIFGFVWSLTSRIVRTLNLTLSHSSRRLESSATKVNVGFLWLRMGVVRCSKRPGGTHWTDFFSPLFMWSFTSFEFSSLPTKIEHFLIKKGYGPWLCRHSFAWTFHGCNSSELIQRVPNFAVNYIIRLIILTFQRRQCMNVSEVMRDDLDKNIQLMLNIDFWSTRLVMLPLWRSSINCTLPATSPTLYLEAEVTHPQNQPAPRGTSWKIHWYLWLIRIQHSC